MQSSEAAAGAMLIVGGDGAIGRALTAALESRGDEVWLTTRRPELAAGRRLLLDMTGDVASWQLPPAPVRAAFLCAAVTSMARCETDPGPSRHVNVESTVTLARRLVESGSFVVFLSTNTVFDGEAPHVEASRRVSPTTEYGRQKAEAETRLLDLGDRVAVVRLTKVLTPAIPVLKDWVTNLGSGRPIYPFSDMVMAPVSIGLAVRVLLDIARAESGGIFQLSASEDVSYGEAALHIARRLGVPEALVQPVSFHGSGIAGAARHTSLATGGLPSPAPRAALDEWIANNTSQSMS